MLIFLCFLENKGVTLYLKYVLSFGGWTLRAPLYLSSILPLAPRLFFMVTGHYNLSKLQEETLSKKKKWNIWVGELSFQDVALVKHLACGLD